MTAPVSIQGAGVQAFFPTAVSERLTPGRGSFDVERTTLQLRPLDGQNNVAVARALASKEPMTVMESGLLVPDRLSSAALPQSMERRIRSIVPITATIEIRRTLGLDHPQVFCLSPQVDPNAPHRYVAQHPTEGVNAICAYAPYQQLFDPLSLQGQYHLVHAIATWIANYLIWGVTKQWIGPEASHVQALIEAQYGDSTCWCRSGRPMRLCCGRLANGTRGTA